MTVACSERSSVTTDFHRNQVVSPQQNICANVMSPRKMSPHHRVLRHVTKQRHYVFSSVTTQRHYSCCNVATLNQSCHHVIIRPKPGSSLQKQGQNQPLASTCPASVHINVRSQDADNKTINTVSSAFGRACKVGLPMNYSTRIVTTHVLSPQENTRDVFPVSAVPSLSLSSQNSSK